MINLATRSKGAVDSNSIMSINSINRQSIKDAHSIASLNRRTDAGSAAGSDLTANNCASSSEPNVQTLNRGQNAQAAQAPGRGQNAQAAQVPGRGQNAQAAQAPGRGQNAQAAQAPGRGQAVQAAQAPGRGQAVQAAQMPNGGQSVRQESDRVQTGRAAQAPEQRSIPALARPVQKGQKTVLGAAGMLNSVKACFGWNTVNSQCDVDVSAFLLGADGKVIGDSWFVFYGETSSPDKSVQLQLESSVDREIVNINFGKLNPDVKKVVFVLTINDALEKNLNFGMMKDAYVRILNEADSTELVSFKMDEYYSNVISMMIGELYLHNGSWKFNAVGNGVTRDLAGLCELYGVQVSG